MNRSDQPSKVESSPEAFERWLETDAPIPQSSAADFTKRLNSRIETHSASPTMVRRWHWRPALAIAAVFIAAAALIPIFFPSTSEDPVPMSITEGPLLDEEAFLIADYFHGIDPVLFNEVADLLECL